MPITFNNPLKASKENKKYPIFNPYTPDTNCKSIFLIEKPVLNTKIVFISSFRILTLRKYFLVIYNYYNKILSGEKSENIFPIK